MNKIKVLYDVVKTMKEKEVFKGNVKFEAAKGAVKVLSFSNEFETNIKSGETPDIKTGTTAQLKPLETEAAVAMKGATSHMNQVTLLGLVCPLNILRI